MGFSWFCSLKPINWLRLSSRPMIRPQGAQQTRPKGDHSQTWRVKGAAFAKRHRYGNNSSTKKKQTYMLMYMYIYIYIYMYMHVFITFFQTNPHIKSIWFTYVDISYMYILSDLRCENFDAWSKHVHRWCLDLYKVFPVFMPDNSVILFILQNQSQKITHNPPVGKPTSSFLWSSFPPFPSFHGNTSLFHPTFRACPGPKFPWPPVAHTSSALPSPSRTEGANCRDCCRRSTAPRLICGWI